MGIDISNQGIISISFLHRGSKHVLISIDINGNNVEHDISEPDALYCYNNLLTSLPDLPEELKVLNCAGNRLALLPNLLQGLTTLDCCENQLTSLPNLPERLEHLYLSRNMLAYLPDLPQSLKILSCNENQLIELPKLLPEKLVGLSCLRN